MKTHDLKFKEIYRLYVKYLGFKELVIFIGRTDNRCFKFKSCKSNLVYIYNLQEVHNLITDINNGASAKLIF